MGKSKIRRYSNSPRDRDPSLVKIILAIMLLLGVGYGIVRFGGWFREDFVTPEAQAAVRKHLNESEAFFADNQFEEAQSALAPILARVERDSLSLRAHLLKAKVDEELGDLESALSHLKTVVDEYSGYSEHSQALVAYATLLENTGSVEEALVLYKHSQDTAPPEVRAPALSGLARQLERAGKTDEAYALYTQASEEAVWHSPAWDEAMLGVGRHNVARLMGVAPTPDSKTYTVTRGDSLTSIGIKLNTTQGLLMRANSMTDPNRLRLNQTLKYTSKDFRIVIERSTCRLYLLDSNGLFKTYHLGLGKPGHETVPGRYKIGNKEKNPTWHKPGFGPIGPDDPANELGTRWMPMVPLESGLPNDLGIHGTIRPESIGHYASNGCPRMRNEEVEELYDLVVRSTPVLVVETYEPGVDL